MNDQHETKAFSACGHCWGENTSVGITSHKGSRGGFYAIRCNDCGMMGPVAPTIAQAATNWEIVANSIERGNR